MKKDEGNDMKEPQISERTLVPVSFLLIILVGVVRVESTNFKANANEEKITTLEKTLEDRQKVLTEIQKSLARIEGAMGIKSKETEQ
jgi:hypothetical protein